MQMNVYIGGYITKLCYFILVCSSLSFAAKPPNAFTILPLGTEGGIVDDNLSAYLLTTGNDHNFILLDAGTIISGLLKNTTQKSLNQLGLKAKSPLELATSIQKKHIKAYLISHAHLDHIAGLVLASPNDDKKMILGIDSTLNDLNHYIFNWKIWPNFANEGEQPFLNKYHYLRLPLKQTVAIPSTKFSLEAWPLNHGHGYPSSAFLISANNQYLLYFGDTGADEIEESTDINAIWKKIIPLIQTQKLKAILIETSYTNNTADQFLYGHLNPKWLLVELTQLAEMVDPDHPQKALRNIVVIITHIKPGIENGKSTSEIIFQELRKNNLGIKFIIPKQGELLKF